MKLQNTEQWTRNAFEYELQMQLKNINKLKTFEMIASLHIRVKTYKQMSMSLKYTFLLDSNYLRL